MQIQGQPDQFCVLVATKLIRCIDDKASEEVLIWTPEDGRPENDAKVFRTWGWSIALIVREDIKDALERLGATGTWFKKV